MGVGIAAVATLAAVVVLGAKGARAGRPPDSAPGRTARTDRFGGFAVVGRTVTINRPRSELYRFWRDFNNLPDFMENVESVQIEGDLTVWTIAAPMNRTVTVKTRIVDERENELIAWRSVEGSEIETEGRVTFREAPNGRGTQTEAIIAYKPPAGELGRIISALFRREPGIQGRHELKRFKMLMETGEVARSENRRKAA
ncbi:MAG: SRPBCC family protein [Alphaproteobacteria bacterium]